MLLILIVKTRKYIIIINFFKFHLSGQSWSKLTKTNETTQYILKYYINVDRLEK